MKAQTTHFADCVFEYVISGGVDFYKVAPPLVNITEASEKIRVKTREMVGEEVVRKGGQKEWSELTERQMKHFADCVFEYGLNRSEAQIQQNLGGLGYEC